MKKWFVISVLLNMLLIGAAVWIIQMNGGERFIKAQWRAMTSDKSFSEYYLTKTSVFKESPDAPVDKAFVGDSLTDYGAFGEYFPDEQVINRGVYDDTSEFVLNRIEEVAGREPKEAYVMVGINDIIKGVEAETYEKNLREIVDAFDTSVTKVALFSILPVNHDLVGNSVKDEEINRFNEIIRKVAEESGAEFIDLHPHFLDDKGQLDRQYTVDGVHLNGKGYDVWLEQMK
ncbi:GDSL-like Lipase/Acylhydrolase [Bhargavaea cecembensis DSE10]|uniref:GDSL-like Lipase/Acylhydrolase n=1 Tax=Bhargavaea cecembensis DSE10 TaxID=1235279 RepID=M7NGY4_9BACL|nr:GDSL-type esterase/lipase family protein [Bhargavaea cecembensis]EMR06517.1 GDSL-like Lipase/Acylhydrolase [Bhargavaea cecembensis DSE10]